MTIPEHHVEFYKNDFTYSKQVVAESFIGAVSTLIPVIGDYQKGKVNYYALHKLMKDKPGNDIVLYPQYETKRFVIPFIYSRRHAKAIARLGKIRE